MERRILLLFSHSVVSDSLWPQGPQHTRLPCPSLSFRVCSNSYSLSQWYIQPSPPLLSPSPPILKSFTASGSFQWVSSSPLWPNYWSYFSISSFNKCSGLISFSIDWFDLLVVQVILKSLCHHHSLKAWHSGFFKVQFSHCTWLLEKL